MLTLQPRNFAITLKTTPELVLALAPVMMGGGGGSAVVTHTLTTLPGHGIVPTLFVVDHTALIAAKNDPLVLDGTWVEVAAGTGRIELYYKAWSSMLGPHEAWIKNPKYVIGTNGESVLIVDCPLTDLYDPQSSPMFALLSVGLQHMTQRAAWGVPVYPPDLTTSAIGASFIVQNKARANDTYVLVIGAVDAYWNGRNALAWASYLIPVSGGGQRGRFSKEDAWGIRWVLDGAEYGGLMGMPYEEGVYNLEGLEVLSARINSKGYAQWGSQTFRFSSLKDVDSTVNVQDGFVPIFNQTTGKWEPRVNDPPINPTHANLHAAALARANHTGTQLAATVSDFGVAADARIALAVIDTLADVVITTPTAGQVIKRNAGNTGWINDADATGGGGSVTTDKTTHADMFSGFVVSGLLSPSTPSLTATRPAGVAYVGGIRVEKAAETFTYEASRDTYEDMNSAGVTTRTVVARFAAAPAIPANNTRIQFVRTSGTSVDDSRRLNKLRASIEGLEFLTIDTATFNYFFGLAGNLTVTGTANVGHGYNSLRNIGSGGANFGGGAATLESNIDGHRNTAVGWAAGNGVTGSFNTVLGQSSEVNVVSGNNQLSICNMLYGVDMDGAFGTVSTGNIGLAVKLPTATLHLRAGTATANKAPLKFNSGPRNTTPAAGQIQYDNNWWMTDSAAVDRRIESTNHTAATFSIAAPGSLVAYQNATGYNLHVLITGGTVTLIEFSRNGTNWFSMGMIAGSVYLNPLDRVRVTYSVAPTMTGIPR